MPSPSLVRVATPDDREAMAAFLRIAHGDNGVASLDEARMLDWLDRGLRRDHAIIGVIGAPGAPIEASIGLYGCSWWYSPDEHIEDHWNFVHPDYRRSRHAHALLRFAKRCSEQSGMQLAIGIHSGTRLATKIALYERIIGPMKGAAFVYDPPQGVEGE